MAGTDTTMMDHEGRLAVIETEIRSAKKEISDNTALTKDGFKEILGILKGTNGDGHSTRIAVIEKSQFRLWKFVGAASIAILLTAISNIIK